MRQKEGNISNNPRAHTTRRRMAVMKNMRMRELHHSMNEPPAAATETQHHSPFNSTAFDQLPQPVPVVDVFFGSWWLLLALRTATRPVIIYISLSWLWELFPFGSGFLAIPAIYLLRWAVPEGRKRHNSDPWGPNSQEASALSGRCFAGHRNFGYLLPALLNQKALLTSCNRSTS